MADLVELLGQVAGGRHGNAAPDSIVLLSGDDHHRCLAEVELTEEFVARPPIFQVTCALTAPTGATPSRRRPSSTICSRAE